MDALAHLTHHRFRRGPQAGQSGFSLIEVLVASVIVILVMYGLMQFFVRGRVQVDYEEDRRKATAVAQDWTEAIRRWDFSYLITRQDDNGTAANDTTYTVDGKTYDASLTVNYDDTVDENLATIIVDVSWTFQKNYNPANLANRTVTVTTLMGRTRL
jgi:prepilin-type N-terminal cleavage/methylation domain-containing protein